MLPYIFRPELVGVVMRPAMPKIGGILANCEHCSRSLDNLQGQTFGSTDGEETWSFGDDATARTKSDNVVPLAKNGFATTAHVFLTSRPKR
jgi:hypothetical protein